MMNKKQKKQLVEAANKVQDVAGTLPEQGRADVLSDILGSYTGTAQNGDVPEQDADDL
jgi:hypothetical protein